MDSVQFLFSLDDQMSEDKEMLHWVNNVKAQRGATYVFGLLQVWVLSYSFSFCYVEETHIYLEHLIHEADPK